MSTTVKFVLRSSNSRSDGTAPIYLRITQNRQSRFLSTGISISPKHWNREKQKVRGNHELAGAYNAKLKKIWLEAEKYALDAFSSEEVKSKLRGSSGSFSQSLDQHLLSLRHSESYWSEKRYRVIQQKIQSCFGASVDWGDLNLQLFERFMADSLGNGSNTIRKEMAMIRTLCTRAVKNGIMQADQNPFLRYEAPPSTSPERRRLDEREIDLLASVNLKSESPEALVRDAWMLSFYLGGMRFGDTACLRVKNFANGRCAYRMNKTGTLISLPVPAPAQQIVDSYCQSSSADDFLLPLLQPGDDQSSSRLKRRISSRNAACNRHIKAVAKLAGIANPLQISMHVSRHSFADYARTKTGNLYAISKTLGHSSLSITEEYLSSFDQDAVDELAQQLWKSRDETI